jgi:hypothetical protein
MKSIILISIYLGAFVMFYLLLSMVGLFFHPYSVIIQSSGWFMGYTLFIGWWMASFPAREYYVHNEEYFDKVF